MKTFLGFAFSATVLIATSALQGPPGGNPPGLNGLVDPGFGGTPPGLQRQANAISALQGPPSGNPPGLNGLVDPGFGGTPPGLQRQANAISALQRPPSGNPPGLNGLVDPGFEGTPPALQRQSMQQVPIPDTLLLFGGGLAALIGWRWDIRRRSTGEFNA
jgi:hypothetical protein